MVVRRSKNQDGTLVVDVAARVTAEVEEQLKQVLRTRQHDNPLKRISRSELIREYIAEGLAREP